MNYIPDFSQILHANVLTKFSEILSKLERDQCKLTYL